MRDDVWRKLRAVAVLDPEHGSDFSQYIPDFHGSERCIQTLLGLLPLQALGRPLIFLTPDDSLDKLRIELDKFEVPYLMASGGLQRGIVRGASQREKRSEVSLQGLQGLASAGPLIAVVTGVAAVTTAGERLGKGHGFFDIEWALLSQLKLVSVDTQIIAVAHDCQVVDHEWESESHDVKVDHIVTPTRSLQTQAKKMLGAIQWERLDQELLLTPMFRGLQKLDAVGVNCKECNVYTDASPALPILPINQPTAMRFNCFANWIVPGRVLVGRYPLMDSAEYMTHFEQVLASGIGTFVCLQAEMPAQGDLAWYAAPGGICLEGRTFLHYAPVAEVLAECPVRFLHEAIGTGDDLPRDRIGVFVNDLIDRVLKGEALYIHCWGGRGRSGMIASCMIGRLYNLTADEAMDAVNSGYATREYNSPHHKMSDAHKDFVRWFLGAA